MNFNKVYIEYSSINLLERHVNFFEFVINDQKLKIIARLTFFAILSQFEIYLKLTKWFRNYIKEYAFKSKFLQNRKTMQLKDFLKNEQARKSYFSKTRILNSTIEEREYFKLIQVSLSKSTFLMHFNVIKQLYVDLDSNKDEIDDIIYYVRNKQSNNSSEYSFKKDVQSILFFSRLLTLIETRYWLIELKIIDFVWVLRKIRHLMRFFKHSIIVYIDHDATLSIAKQTTLFTSFIDKLNLRLVRISDYIQCFDFIIKHKLDKLHIVSNALSRFLLFSMFEQNLENELNVLFTISLIEINNVFKARIVNDYVKNSNWQKIIKIIEIVEKNYIRISFVRDQKLIFRKEIEDFFFISRRMCISSSIIKDVLSITYDYEHQNFDRTYKKIVSSWYIRNLTKHFKAYFKHCLQCKINQIKRHKSYESLQSILSSSIFFHTLIIDFILTLSKSWTDMNNVMSITCKYFKRITIISSMNTWNASQWINALLNKLDIADWRLSKVIIFDRDRKFLFALWKALFLRLEIKLLYSIAYHSQFDDSFERTNQIIEIALRFMIFTIESKN